MTLPALGGAVDVGLLACALTMCFLAWRGPESSRSVLAWASGGAACLLLFAWTGDVLPTHLLSPWISIARAGLLLLGCCALLRSVFLDLPSQRIRIRPKLQGRNERAPVWLG